MMDAQRTPPGQPLSVDYGGETVWLLPERALYWPAGRVLFVADLHLGKAATYRALGQPVPAGTTRENLARLSSVAAALPAIATDLPGGFSSCGGGANALRADRAGRLAGEFAALDCVLVRGNHDSRAGDPPASLGIRVVDEPFAVGPFAACHHPQSHATHSVLAGHLHPVLNLRGPGRDHLRLPCFCIEAGLAILPAFGEFTGGWSVAPQAGRQLYPVGGQAVWRLPEP
jgi:DNA ligase-associated metallophosphoesterase